MSMATTTRKTRAKAPRVTLAAREIELLSNCLRQHFIRTGDGGRWVPSWQLELRDRLDIARGTYTGMTGGR